MLEAGVPLSSPPTREEHERFLVEPTNPGCGQPIEVGASPVVLGRQHCWTSKVREKKCSRRQAVLSVSRGRLQIECAGQNPVHISRRTASVPEKEGHGAFRLKTGQRQELLAGDCFALVSGGCLLRVVQKRPDGKLDWRPDAKLDAGCSDQPLRELCPNERFEGRSQGVPDGECPIVVREGDCPNGVLKPGCPNGVRQGDCPNAEVETGYLVGVQAGDGHELLGAMSPATLRSEGSKRVLAEAQKAAGCNAGQTRCSRGISGNDARAVPAGKEPVFGGLMRTGGGAERLDKEQVAASESPLIGKVGMGGREVVPGTPEESEEAAFGRAAGRGSQRRDGAKVARALRPSLDRPGLREVSDPGQNEPGGRQPEDTVSMQEKSTGFLGDQTSTDSGHAAAKCAPQQSLPGADLVFAEQPTPLAVSPRSAEQGCRSYLGARDTLPGAIAGGDSPASPESPVSLPCAREPEKTKGKAMRGPGDKAGNRWEELGKYEIEETPPSMDSPALEASPARDASNPGESSPSSKTSRGSLGKQRSGGGLASKAGLLTKSFGGLGSEEKGRPREGNKRRWSPPPPPSSDHDESEPSIEERGFRAVRLDASLQDQVSGLSKRQAERGKRLLQKGNGIVNRRKSDRPLFQNAALGSGSDSDGLGEASGERPNERNLPIPTWKKLARELSLSESESSDDSLGEGSASPGGRSRAQEGPPEPRESLKQSSSLEKEEGRRLRKVGGVQPSLGHCALPLFSRAPPRNERSEDRNSPSEEDGDVPGRSLEEYAEGGCREEYVEGGSPGWEPRGGLAGEEDPRERPNSGDERQNSVSSERTDPGGADQEGRDPPGPRQLSDLCVSSTNYRGDDKMRLKRMIAELGIRYTDDFGPRNTHLVCWSFEGGKFEKAKIWGIPRVNHRWVEDCAWRREVVPADDYCDKAGEDVGPLPESQPSLSPSQPFISSPPLPFERGPDAAVNNGARAGVQGAAGEHPPETSRSSDSGRGSDGSESDGSKSDGDRRISGLEPSESEEGSDRLGGMRSWPARPWAPPSPPPLEESLLDFEEWKRRNLAKGEKKGPLTGGGLRRDETEAQRRDENETRRFDLSEGDVGGSDEDVIEDSGRLGGGRERSSRKRRTSRRCEHEGRGDEERGKRKRFRKSSLSEQLCSSSGSGDSQRNGSVGAGGLGTGVARGAFNVGGMVYEEKNREGRFDVEEEEDCVEVPGAEGRRPLKRLKKLKVTKGETQKEGDLHGGRGGGSRPGGSGRRQGAAATGWKEFDPKDWVDWNSGDMPQEATGLNLREEEDGFANEPLGGFGIGANERAERRSSHLEGLDEEFAGEEVWGAGLGLTERNGRPFGGFDHLQRESPEAAHGRFGVSGVEQEARIADQRPVSGGHVSHSQHWEGDVTLASLPSSEHPLHLPRAAETARELSDRSDRRPRTSGGRGSQPAVKQRTLDNMWAKAGASLRDDRPPRKKRRGPPEGFAAARHAQATAGGYGGATRVHQTNATRGDPAKTPPGSKTPLPVKTPQQSGIARKLALLSPGGEVACAICWEARASAEQGVLPCGHGFCYHCVIKWAKEEVNVEVNGKPTLLSKWKAEAKCPLCKTPYDFVTKRHSPDSEGVALEDEVVQLPAGTFADLEGAAPANAPPSTGMAEQRPVPRVPGAYARGNRGRGISRGSNGPRVYTDENGTGRSRVSAPAAGMDPWFGRFLAGQQPGAQRGAQSWRRTLPHAGPG